MRNLLKIAQTSSRVNEIEKPFKDSPDYPSNPLNPLNPSNPLHPPNLPNLPNPKHPWNPSPHQPNPHFEHSSLKSCSINLFDGDQMGNINNQDSWKGYWNETVLHHFHVL